MGDLTHRDFDDPASNSNPSAGPDRPMGATGPADSRSDDQLVSRARDGDLDAFEVLVRRHQRRIFRTLMGIVGRREDAEDGIQNAFLKAYRGLQGFTGASAFSTWLTRIAINEGIERLRSRRDHEAIDESDETEELWRPRRLRSWMENPEEAFGRTELREMVEREVLRLPAKYRVVVMMRDIESMPADEVAAALELPVATVKTRLLRGRLMLREALAPHFSGPRREPVRA